MIRAQCHDFGCRAPELERALAAAHALLREWLATELDPEDEEYDAWLESFTERVNKALKGAK